MKMYKILSNIVLTDAENSNIFSINDYCDLLDHIHCNPGIYWKVFRIFEVINK